jgi:hypothetical protein
MRGEGTGERDTKASGAVRSTEVVQCAIVAQQIHTAVQLFERATNHYGFARANHLRTNTYPSQNELLSADAPTARSTDQFGHLRLESFELLIKRIDFTQIKLVNFHEIGLLCGGPKCRSSEQRRWGGGERCVRRTIMRKNARSGSSSGKVVSSNRLPKSTFS